MSNVSAIRECIRERNSEAGKEGMVKTDEKVRTIKTGEILKIKH